MKFGTIIISAWLPTLLAVLVSTPLLAEGTAKDLLGRYLRNAVNNRTVSIPDVTTDNKPVNMYQPYPITVPRRISSDQSFPDFTTMANITQSWTSVWASATSDESLKAGLDRIGTDFSSRGVSKEGLNAVADLLRSGGNAASTPPSASGETGLDTLAGGGGVPAAPPADGAAAPVKQSVQAVAPQVIASSSDLAKDFGTQADKQTAQIDKAKADADQKFNNLADKQKQAEDANRQAALANAYNQGAQQGAAQAGGQGGGKKGDDGGDDKGDEDGKDKDSANANNSNGLDKLLGQQSRGVGESDGLSLPKDPITASDTPRVDPGSVVNPSTISNQGPTVNQDPKSNKVQLAFGGPSTPNQLAFANSQDMPKLNSVGSQGNSGKMANPAKGASATDGDAYPNTGSYNDSRGGANNFVNGGIFQDTGSTGGGGPFESGEKSDASDEGSMASETVMAGRAPADQLASSMSKSARPGVFGAMPDVCTTDLKDNVFVCHNPKLHLHQAVEGTTTLPGPLQAGLLPG